MASPILFPGANMNFVAPDDRDDIGELPSFQNKAGFVSCWQLSHEEMIEIDERRLIWLSVMGCSMPPVFLGSETEMRAVQAEFGLWAPRVETQR